MQCSVCGQDGATQYYSADKDADISAFAWFHVLCLAKNQVVQACEKLRWSKPSARGYLAGLIDGEGHIHRRTGHICIVNNDIHIIAAGKSAAEKLGIRTSITMGAQRPGYAPTYKLNLLGGRDTRKRLLRFPMRSVAKLEMLRRYI